MLNEVELMEELPYYRTLQKPPPMSMAAQPLSAAQYHHHPPPPPHHHHRNRLVEGCYDETSIAIIAPDIRMPQNNNPLSVSSIEYCEQYAALGIPAALVSLLSYTADVGTDVALCYLLFREGRLWWSALTGSFALVAALVVNAMSVWWYVRNSRCSASVYVKTGKLTWGLRAVFHVLLVGLFYRYLYLLCSCLCHSDSLEDRENRSVMEARKRKNAIRQMTIKEDKQTALLCLLHSFLESAPQLILQLYMLAHRTDSDSLFIILLQGGCAISSLFQLSWSITSYNNALHRIMPGKRRGTTVGLSLHFLWHFCTIGSRACTLALFTKEYHFWLFPFCIGHWGVMTIWVMHQQTRFCRRNGELHQCKEYLCNMVVGVAYVIYYLNVKAEPTRYKYSAYYAIVFAENFALMTLWFLRNDPGVWYHIPALVAVFSSFASGIVFMLFYYGAGHRTLKQTNEKRAAHCC